MYEDAPLVLKNFLTQKLTIEGKSPNTVKEYYYDLKGFLNYLAEIKDHDGEVDIDFIKKIELNDIYEYLMFISNEKHNSARTRSRRVSSIKSFFKYLYVKVKLIDTNPTEALDPPKFKSTVPRYLELDESKRLLSCVDGRHKERDFAILTLFLNCGIRLSELVGINLADIKKDTMVVKGKGNKERTIYLNDACISAINDYLAVRPKLNVSDERALFISGQNKRIYYKTVQFLVKKYIAAAGLDPTKYSTHKLRHTAATLMYKYGKVDVRALQEILGHEQLSTTQIYTRVSNDQIKEAVDKNPLASFGKENKDQ